MCEKLPKKWICIELRIFGALAPYCAFCTTCTSNTLRPIVLSPSQQQRQHRRAHRAFPSRSLKCGDILLKLTLVKQNYVYIVSFWGFLLYLASIIPNFYLLPSRSIPLSCVCVCVLFFFTIHIIHAPLDSRLTHNIIIAIRNCVYIFFAPFLEFVGFCMGKNEWTHWKRMTTATHRETEKNRIQPIEKITFVLNQWRHKLYIVYVYRGDAFISLLSHSKLTNRKCFCCGPYRTHFFFVSCVCDTFWNSTIDFCSVYYLYRYHVIFLFGFVLFAFFLFPFFCVSFSAFVL